MNSYELILKVRQLINFKKFDHALKEVTIALTVFPDNVELYFLKGYTMYRKGQAQEALDVLYKALNLDATYDEIYNLLGSIYLSEDCNKKAEQNFRLALEISPEDPVYLGNLSRVYLRRGDVKKTIEYAEKGLANDPDSEVCFNSLYWAYFVKGNYRKADSALKKNLQQNPENLETLLNYGNSLLINDKHEEAEKVFASLLSMRADSKEAIKGYKEASAGNNTFYRWIHGDGGERFMLIVLGIAGYGTHSFIRWYDAPSRVYWLILLFFSIIFGVFGMAEGVGKLIAFKIQKQLRAQYSHTEIALAVSLPLIFVLSIFLTVLTAAKLAGLGDFPSSLYVSVIYLSFLQFALAMELNENFKDIGVLEKAIYITYFIFAILSITVPSFVWIGFSVCMLSILTYGIRMVLPFLRARSLRQIWKSF